jgi:hypothetical protein
MKGMVTVTDDNGCVAGIEIINQIFSHFCFLRKNFFTIFLTVQ